jgi:hypothetical protein
MTTPTSTKLLNCEDNISVAGLEIDRMAEKPTKTSFAKERRIARFARRIARPRNCIKLRGMNVDCATRKRAQLVKRDMQ